MVISTWPRPPTSTRSWALVIRERVAIADVDGQGADRGRRGEVSGGLQTLQHLDTARLGQAEHIAGGTGVRVGPPLQQPRLGEAVDGRIEAVTDRTPIAGQVGDPAVQFMTRQRAAGEEAQYREFQA